MTDGDQKEDHPSGQLENQPTPLQQPSTSAETGNKPDDSISNEDHQGPGCMPAIIALAALTGIVIFITCAVMTWVIFQKRTELAIRTLEGAYLPQVEQSLLDPESKQEVIREVNDLLTKMKSGRFEDWQSAGIMQSLQKLPVFQWGEIQALEAAINEAPETSFSKEEKSESLKQISRLKRAVELNKVFSFDFETLLDPIRIPSPTTPGSFVLKRPLDDEEIREVIRRAKSLSDRSEIADQFHEGIDISEIFAEQVQRASILQD